MGCHSVVAGFTNKVPTLTRDTTPSSLGVCIYVPTSHASRGWWPTDHTRAEYRIKQRQAASSYKKHVRHLIIKTHRAAQ